MYDFKYVNALTLTDAVAALGTGGAQVIAGNTDLNPYMKSMCSPNPPTTLVNINHVIPSLNYINTDTSGTLHIGALTTLATIAASSTVSAGWKVLAQAAAAASNPELRNMGTIGGNICQKPRCLYFRNAYNDFNCLRKNPSGMCYALVGVNTYHSIFGPDGGCIAVCPSDTASALVALGASIVTTVKTWAAADFFVISGEQINAIAPTEIVTEIQVPALASGTTSTYLKFAFRKSIDFPLVSCAAVITSASGTVSKASIVLGGVYNTPKRATDAEKSITGQAINTTTATAAGQATATAATPTALPLNLYKVQIAKTLIKRALLGLPATSTTDTGP
jgi:xanthine dehydrogenase YagS FAD-binding subunit